MQSLASVGGVTASAGPYPFDEELGTDEVQDTDVVIVDIGGGRGQALESIKAAFPRLKGRMVLQDVPDVIEEAKAGGLPSFIEPMAVSFFERQPIEGKQIGASVVGIELDCLVTHPVLPCGSGGSWLTEKSWESL